jgi:ubiquinol-cytochrome c reductase core subunit 2
MACNASKTSFLRAIAKRGYAATANPRAIGQVAEVTSQVVGNKMVVATAESSLPVSRVSIVFRAGSRNESYDEQGAAHMLRLATHMSNRRTSGFAVTRNIQQRGGSLVGANDREVVSYTLETTADNLECGLQFLQDVVQPAFKPWELSDNVPSIKNHLAGVPPQAQAVELLHKAAFRNGLGNSIYIPKYQIGRLSSETLLHYVCSNYTTGRCAVVGIGIDQNTLSGFAQCLDVQAGDGNKQEQANYYGGDARKETAGSMAHVAIAGQGGALLNQKEALAFAVLHRACGAGAATKRGNVNGSFGKAMASAASGSPVQFSTLNLSYSDAGLFGVVVSADTDVICKAVDAVAKALKSGAVSEEDVKRGKSLLKAELMETYSSDRLLLPEMATQALLTKTVQPIEALLAAVDAITPQQVQEAAKKAGSSKLSVGAVGNLGNVPYSTNLA